MRRSVIVLALTLMVAAPLAAQVSQETELTYQIIKEEWNSLVAEAMDLTEEEATVFWPLYKVYSLEMAEVEQRRIDGIVRYLEELPAMTDEQALGFLYEDLAIDGDRLEIVDRYAKSFEHVLPAKKIVRLFQIENRLRTMVRMQAMKDIPLTD